MKKKIVLAYSGGLDTSVILKWLIEKDYDVVAYIADIGQKEDFSAARKKALAIGAKKVYVVDLKKEFVSDCIFTAIKANAVYEGKYLLGTSLARPLIAKGQIEIARKEKTNIVAHGATGKGNDQVRFEVTYQMLMSDVEIISPWRDDEFLRDFEGRKDLIAYAIKHKIPVKASVSKPYSIDDNIMHTSFEAGQLEDPYLMPNKEMFEKTKALEDTPDEPAKICVEFKDGIPVSLTHDKKKFTDSLELFTYLNELAGLHGIGRVDLVENRFVGMKSRGVYETPAGTVLMAAHLDIEGLTMDREVKLLRDSLSPKYASLIYNGLWYSPEFELLNAFMNKAQEYVTGKVNLKLFKGNVVIEGRSSNESLYNPNIASMDKHGGYNQKDADGFIKLNVLRLKASASRLIKRK
ncbi:MAG: argininosuccinate synthase [Nanoarchaeota archaeon]